MKPLLELAPVKKFTEWLKEQKAVKSFLKSLKKEKPLREAHGLSFPDVFIEYLYGYSSIHRAMQDGLEGLRKQTDGIQASVFPTREVPVADRPGYVTYEHNYFQIRHPDPAIVILLEKYFLRDLFIAPRKLYGSNYNLAGLLSSAVQNLFIYGKQYYSIEWGDVEFGEISYQLPKKFHYLDTLTTRKKLSNGYKQTYSLITYHFDSHFKSYMGDHQKGYARTFSFTNDEIVKFTSPFEGKSPVQKTYQSVPELRAFWQFGLDQQRTSLQPKNHSYPLERARHTTYQIESRKYNLLKARVSHKFKNLIDTNLEITGYYDVFNVIQYKKGLNDLRNSLVRDFNSHVFSFLAARNKWETSPELYFDSFLTNDELDALLKDYKEGSIDVKDFSTVIKNDRR